MDYGKIYEGSENIDKLRFTSADAEQLEQKLLNHLQYLSATGDGKGTFKYKQTRQLIGLVSQRQFI